MIARKRTSQPEGREHDAVYETDVARNDIWGVLALSRLGWLKKLVCPSNPSAIIGERELNPPLRFSRPTPHQWGISCCVLARVQRDRRR